MVLLVALRYNNSIDLYSNIIILCNTISLRVCFWSTTWGNWFLLTTFKCFWSTNGV